MPLLSFGQDELNINKFKDSDTGIFYLGKGKFNYQNYFVRDLLNLPRRKFSYKEAKKEIVKYAKERDAIAEITNTSYYTAKNIYIIDFILKKSDGSIYLTKEEAIKEIKKLKELFDLEILSKEEYDQKLIILKNIILKQLLRYFKLEK